MYNDDQPRDANGRWAKTKGAKASTGNFIDKYGDEIALGLAITGAAALTYGAVVATGTSLAVKGLAPEAAKIVTRAATVRKVGPVGLKGAGKLIPALKNVKSVEAYQYGKGFLSPNLVDGPIKGGIRQVRVGAEVVTKTGKKTLGAPKPLLYDQINFKHNNNLSRLGRGLAFGATAASAATTGVKLHKRD